MSSSIAFALFAVIAPLVLLATTRVAPAVILCGAMVFVSFTGVISPGEALRGFVNPAVLTIAVLYVVVAGLKHSGVIAWISDLPRAKPRRLTGANAWLLSTATGLSTVVSNTAIVAMFIPIAESWAKRYGIPISRILLPLNNAVILGGVCTLIGTSTNLAVNGLYAEMDGGGLKFFELAWVGVPLALLRIGYALVAAPWLLPTRAAPHRSAAEREPNNTFAPVPEVALVEPVLQGAAGLQRAGLFAEASAVSLLNAASTPHTPREDRTAATAQRAPLALSILALLIVSIDFSTVIGIAASLALGTALTKSGAASQLAAWAEPLAQGDALLALILLYVATVIVTEIVTNNAAGVVMFPIAVSMAASTGADPKPFIIAVMVGASAGFLTPIGYQTNLMVYGPGGYRLIDFVRYGLPLSLLTGLVTLLIVPRVWPL
jgi:di/tricarboxylate transporter